MHRNFRCLLIAAAIGTFSLFTDGDISSIRAQNPPVTNDGAIAQSPAKADSGNSPQSRLSVRMKLGDGERIWRPSRKQIGVRYEPGASDSTPSGSFKFRVDPVVLQNYLGQIAPYVHKNPRDARVTVDPSASTESGGEQVPAIIVPEKSGVDLDIASAVKKIKASVESDPSTLHVVLPLRTRNAEVRESDLKGIDSRIGYFVTRFNPSDRGRTQTVRRAIEIIDGHVIEPGAILSINDVVGERTGERGFGMGHVFVDGKIEMQLGGGMCQVATTLFNASMLADLKIVERHQHVRTVPYVPAGRDATVYFGHKDFRVQNDTDTPIYVSYKTTRNHAIVGLFGRGTPGRKVKLVGRSTRLGERWYKGVFYRVVYRPDGTVVKDKPYLSSYKWTPALDFSH